MEWDAGVGVGECIKSTFVVQLLRADAVFPCKAPAVCRLSASR